MGEYDLIINNCNRIGCTNKIVNYWGKTSNKSTYCSKDCRETMLGITSNIHNREMIAAKNNPRLRHDEDKWIFRRII